MALIRGTDASETVRGFDTSDDIYAYGGNDLIYGYDGDDLIYAGAGDDRVSGGAGDDDIFGNSGINTLYGGSGADWFRMSARSDALSDDFISDFTFDEDRIDLRAWGVSDIYQVKSILADTGSGNAILNAAYGGYNHLIEIADTRASEFVASDFVLNSSTAALTIDGTNGYGDTLFGGRGADEINGLGGGDRLLGGVGDDDIFGGSGNDRLWGGAGSDLLNGGTGDDTFSFLLATDMASPNGLDTIADFHVNNGIGEDDLIDFARIDADATLSGNQAFAFIGRDAFDDPGQLRFQFSGSSTLVYGNTDNDASAEFTLRLTGNIDLAREDFIV